MANWCSTSYTFVGKKEELNKLFDIMKQLESMEQPFVKNGFGTNWLGCLVEKLGQKWDSIWCRGEWSNLSYDDGKLLFCTETAWSAANEVMDFICKKFPSLKYYYYSEECGMGIYETNDDTGQFYPEKYFVDLCNVNEEFRSEYFISLEDALEWIGDMTDEAKFKSEKEVEAYFEAIQEKQENAFCYIHRIELIEK